MTPWLDDGDVRLAYLAGIIDGEGYIGIKRMQRRYHARVQVGMVERQAIDLLRDTFGGSLTLEALRGRGRDIWRWHLSGLQAEACLIALQPFLRVKRLQAEAVLALRRFQRNERSHRTKIVGERVFPNAYGTARTVPNLAHSDEYVAQLDAMYLRCRALNRRGVSPQNGVVPG